MGKFPGAAIPCMSWGDVNERMATVGHVTLNIILSVVSIFVGSLLNVYVCIVQQVEKWFGKHKELAAVNTVCSHVQNMIKGVTVVSTSCHVAIILCIYTALLNVFLVSCPSFSQFCHHILQLSSYLCPRECEFV